MTDEEFEASMVKSREKAAARMVRLEAIEVILQECEAKDVRLRRLMEEVRREL